MFRKTFLIHICGLICVSRGLIAAETVRLQRPHVLPENFKNFIKKQSIFDSYVVGGNESVPHSRPYQAALLVEANDLFLCGGSLISKQFVLTAATCIHKAKQILVILGAHNLTSPEPSQKLILADYYTRHYAWDQEKNLNNIGVVKLSIPINVTSTIKPIKLPYSSQSEPSTAVLSGWGRTSNNGQGNFSVTLHEVSLTVMSNTCCDQIVDNITSLHMCTSGKGQKGACEWDVGSPLVSYETQYGIVSTVNTDCQSNFPTVYTRVKSFLNWIYANTDAE